MALYTLKKKKSDTHVDFEPKLMMSQMKASPWANTLAEWQNAQELHPTPATGQCAFKYSTVAQAPDGDGKNCFSK